MVGGGAQVVVFTTGLGTPTGNPIAPVIKITGNARTARQMADNLDLEVSGIMNETETLDAAADRLFAEVLAVASGKADRGRAARSSGVRDSSAQPDDLTRAPAIAGPTHMLETSVPTDRVAPGRPVTRPTAGSSAPCCSLPRRSTTSIAR